MTLPLPILPENQTISIQGEYEETEDGPMFYVLIFLMVFVFSSGICWLFCCGTCVGRDTLRMFGFGRFSPSSNYNRRGTRNYRYSPASTEEEEWEMLANANNENNVRVADDEESVLDNDQEYSALQ